VLNIVDSFLLEGQKVLYRYGIAILDSFYKSFNTSGQRSPTLQPNFMKDYASNINLSFDKLIKVAFGLRNMSRKNIENLFQAEEKAIKKLRAKNSQNQLNLIDKQQLSRKDSSVKTSLQQQQQQHKEKNNSFTKTQLIEQVKLENEKKFYLSDAELNDSTATNNAAPSSSLSLCNRASWTLSDAFKSLGILNSSKKWHDRSSLIHNHSFYHHHHPQSNFNLPSFSLENTGSIILSAKQIAQVWKWLPSRYQIMEMEVIYSTNIHGRRLMTLFDKIEFYASSIIVIKTMKNSIFGAFCAHPWSDRIDNSTVAGFKSKKASYFGNGETFLFELSPNVIKYEWVGKKCHGDTTANQELFMFANNDNLIVGGSTELTHGPGLLVNSSLVDGRSCVSDTFENKTLGTEEHFEISILEVLSFNSS
jgi:hypothetical protein